LWKTVDRVSWAGMWQLGTLRALTAPDISQGFGFRRDLHRLRALERGRNVFRGAQRIALTLPLSPQCQTHVAQANGQCSQAEEGGKGEDAE
jgi:hypothetical protein